MSLLAPGIIVLGPSRWTDEGDEARSFEVSPLEVRRAIVERLEALGTPALILEDQKMREEEDNFEFFVRVLDHADIQTFVLFWPVGARLHGLEVEIGHLLTRMEDGKLEPGAVYVLAEKRNLGVEEKEAVLAWKEPGNRTWYHEDIIARDCPVRRWTSPRSLWGHVGSIAWEHRERHEL